MRYSPGDPVDVRAPNHVQWKWRGKVDHIIGSDCADRTQQQCWYGVLLTSGGIMKVRHHQLRPANILERLAMESGS